MDRVARQGPLTRAPGALNRGHFRNWQHFCRSWRGTFWTKKQTTKKVSQCQKTGRGTLWRFSTSIWLQNIKILKGEIFVFGKKISQYQKIWKAGPFGIFQHPFWRNTAGKWMEDTLGKKVSQCQKNWNWRPFALARYGMLRVKTGKTFFVEFARPNGAIWCNNILKNF